jgi:hypothetical protein
MRLVPVTLPPGRAKLATSPLPTGSPAAAITMGIVEVARLAANGASVPTPTITSTLRLTSSAASAGSRSRSFSAYLPSSMRFLRSINPSSRRSSRRIPCSVVTGPEPPAVRMPILWSFSNSCAFAPSGHAAAAAPDRIKNSRRLIRSPRRRSRAAWAEGRVRALWRPAD